MKTVKKATANKYSHPKLLVKYAKVALATLPISLGKNIPKITNKTIITEEMYITERFAELLLLVMNSTTPFINSRFSE